MLLHRVRHKFAKMANSEYNRGKKVQEQVQGQKPPPTKEEELKKQKEESIARFLQEVRDESRRSAAVKDKLFVRWLAASDAQDWQTLKATLGAPPEDSERERLLKAVNKVGDPSADRSLYWEVRSQLLQDNHVKETVGEAGAPEADEAGEPEAGPSEADDSQQPLLSALLEEFEKEQALLKDPEIRLQVLLEELDKKELEKAFEVRAEERAKRPAYAQLPPPKLAESYTDIKNLLDIEKNPVYAKALEEWRRSEKLSSSRVERKKTRVANLKNEIYQLLGFFSVFQGVVLTAVAQSSALHCHNVWSPISLSVLASAVSIGGVLQKLYHIHDLQKTIDTDEREYQTFVRRGSILRQKGAEKFSFAEGHKFADFPKPKPRNIAWVIYSLVVFLSLVAFGVLFPVSFWRILCYPDSDSNAAVSPSSP